MIVLFLINVMDMQFCCKWKERITIWYKKLCIKLVIGSCPGRRSTKHDVYFIHRLYLVIGSWERGSNVAISVSDTINGLFLCDSSANAANCCRYIPGKLTRNTSEIERYIDCEEIISGRYVQLLNTPDSASSLHLFEVEIIGF